MKDVHKKIAVDLDGTLAQYDKWVPWNEIGPVIELMKDRIIQWLKEGKEVCIFTARVGKENDICWKTREPFTAAQMIKVIQDWLETNGLPRLEVTCRKDNTIIEFWDDRAIQVIPNTGRTLAEEHIAEITALKGKAFQGA